MNVRFYTCLMALLMFFNTKAQDDLVNPVRVVDLDVGIVSGSYGIYFKNTESDRELITKPIIIVEGYDLGSDFKNSSDEVHSEIYDFPNTGFMECLRNRGFDIITLSFKRNGTSIPDNAKLLKKLIRELKSELDVNGSKHQMSVIGVSMGGQIARYALTDMEYNNEDHRVQNYISLDSPHLGANLPLGYQHFANFLASPFVHYAEIRAVLDRLGIHYSDFAAELKLANTDFLSQPAAIEMAYLYKNQNGLRWTYLNDLEDIGSYPKNSRNIGIAIGSNGLETFSASEKLLEWENNRCLFDEEVGIPGTNKKIRLRWCPYTFEHIVHASPGVGLNNTVYHFNGVTQKAAFFPIESSPDYFKTMAQRDYLNAPFDINEASVDYVPGSTQRFSFIEDYNQKIQDAVLTWGDLGIKNIKFRIRIKVGFIHINWDVEIPISNLEVGTGNIKAEKIFGKFSSDTDYHFTFVPTLSALALKKDDWFYNIEQVSNYPYPDDKSETFFDAIVFNTVNGNHPWINGGYDSILDFLELEVAPSDLYIQNRNFDINYVNVFEANNIFIGNDIDPILNRSQIGNVVHQTGSDIEYSVPPNGSINISKGFSVKSGSTVRFKVDDNQPLYSNCTFTALQAPVDNSLKPVRNLDFNSGEFDNVDNSFDLNKASKKTEIPFHFYVSPNPNEGSFDVNLKGGDSKNECKVAIRDLFGKQIFSESAKANSKLKVNLYGYEKGVYLVTVNVESQLYTERIIIR